MKKKSKNSAFNIIWEPETLKEYMELAESDLKYDELFDLFPEINNVEVYAGRALNEGISLIKLFRMPKHKISKDLFGDFETNDEGYVFWQIKHEWVLKICRLWIYTSNIIRALDNPPCEEYWPKRPGIEGLGEVGRAALEVIELFACLLGDIAYDALKSVFGLKDCDDLVYDFIEKHHLVLEPNLEPKAVTWFNTIKDVLIKAYPSSRWPEVVLDRDRKRLGMILSVEEEEALKAQKDSEKDDLSNNANKKEDNNNICHGTKLVNILGHQNAFMSYSDLASIFNVDAEVLRKRLDRYREKNPLDPDFYVESQDRGFRRPKYLYNVKYAVKMAEKLRRSNMSD